MFSVLQNSFWFKQKMFSRTEIMFWAIQIIFSMIGKIFRAAQKVVSVTAVSLFFLCVKDNLIGGLAAFLSVLRKKKERAFGKRGK